MLTRRGFFGLIAGAAVAPAVLKAEQGLPITPPVTVGYFHTSEPVDSLDWFPSQRFICRPDGVWIRGTWSRKTNGWTIHESDDLRVWRAANPSITRDRP